MKAVSTIERAFQLARAGACHSVADIRLQLANEGFENVHGHLSGAGVQRQLREVLAARGAISQSRDDEDADA
ncbi:MAG: hypothetical protein EOO77_09830 [Oxalobacteraceae bacterium]|nr:MAG: hypothetical protein EOO77_09830 [Oxalobacteraceae bacterium]